MLVIPLAFVLGEAVRREQDLVTVFVLAPGSVRGWDDVTFRNVLVVTVLSPRRIRADRDGPRFLSLTE